MPEPGERSQHSLVGYLPLDLLCPKLFGVENPTCMKLQEEQWRDPKSAGLFRNRLIYRNCGDIPRGRRGRGYPSNEARI